MILVVALNPALDITHHVAGADWAGVNRPLAVRTKSGGKGLNVARTLRALGLDVTVAGLAGGPAGEELQAGLEGTGIETALMPIAGHTRRTFAIVDTVRGRTALFNEPGPAISGEEYRRFCVLYAARLASSAAVVISGSLPDGVPADAYAVLIATAAAAEVPVVLDSSGMALSLGAAAGPTLVKPNLAELAAAAGRSLGSEDEPDLAAVDQAARSLAAGASTVVVSLGAHGAVAAGPGGSWRGMPPGPVAGNPTGAGDALVAGLAAGLVLRRQWPDSLRHAIALGTAAAGAAVAGEVSLDEYERLVPQVRLDRLARAAGSARSREAEPV
jgi:tagatose 6-phosphate kinase